MGTYIGAVDLGTTSNRFIIFDQKGRIAGLDQKEHEQIFPQPGWVEHDPEDIWQSVLAAVAEALETGAVSASEVRTIGITNQRETTLVWNKKNGRPYHNAIVWQC